MKISNSVKIKVARFARHAVKWDLLIDFQTLLFPSHKTIIVHVCSTVVICSFPKWTPWKFVAIRRRRSCSAFVLCRSYVLPGRNSSSAFASKPSAINGKCYNSWVVVVVLSCSPFFASHPQSQFGKAHSTRPTSLVTRVVLTLPTNQTDELLCFLQQYFRCRNAYTGLSTKNEYKLIFAFEWGFDFKAH